MPVDALARLAADPAFAALFLDVDGVLAPIVDRPEDALVPEATRNELRRLATRYGLVACVTGLWVTLCVGIGIGCVVREIKIRQDYVLVRRGDPTRTLILPGKIE